MWDDDQVFLYLLPLGPAPVALVGSVLAGVLMLVGPAVAAAIHKLGMRLVYLLLITIDSQWRVHVNDEHEYSTGWMTHPSSQFLIGPLFILL